MKEIRRVAAAGLFVLALTFSLFLIRSGPSAAPDYQRVSSTQGLEEKIIEVAAGATGSQIALTLYEAGIVKSSQSFFRVAVSDSRSQQIAPGLHKITMKISAQQALEQLLDPERIPNLVKVFEGERKSEIVESLQKYGFTSTEIRNAFAVLKLPNGFKDSEGLLFPAQYSFVDGISAADALQQMIDRFQKDSVGIQLLRGSKSYSSLELLTIASIIQAEGDASNFDKVSRVIYNRLNIGMPLQMDSTVHFIMNVRGNIFLSSNSTKLKSAYNTYRNYGLPPGPIGSPGTQAMRAALNPTMGDWLYFITVAPGDTRFTSDFDQFNSWKVLYTKNRKAGAFN